MDASDATSALPISQLASKTFTCAKKAAAALEKAQVAFAQADARLDELKKTASTAADLVAHCSVFFRAREELAKAESAAKAAKDAPNVDALIRSRKIADEGLKEAKLALQITRLVLEFFPANFDGLEWDVPRLSNLNAALKEAAAVEFPAPTGQAMELPDECGPLPRCALLPTPL